MIFTLENFYTSNDWQKFRKSYLAERIAKDGDLIDDVTKTPIKAGATLHHIIYLTEENVNNREISLNPNNIQLVSPDTHARIHGWFNSNPKKIFIAKTSENINQYYDIIIEWDRIHSALGTNDSTSQNTWRIYNDLIDQVRTRMGRWSVALVICKGGGIEFNRIKRLLGAEEI